MNLEHAIYGSASGLGDYQILAASPRFDDRLRAAVGRYANLEWSALTTPFAPIYSFYAIANNLWAFAQTRYLGPTTRGNDYLVHAIVFDAAALAQLDARPFLLVSAFASQKPAQKALAPLEFIVSEEVRVTAPLPGPAVAASLRALAKGPLRLRVDTDEAAAICRDLHEALPPSDRMRTTFCTRFSYGRSLDFRLAAFAGADEDRLRAQATDATIIAWPPPESATPDLFDRWTNEVRGQADLDLVGPSILRDAGEAFALLDGVRKLRLWTAGESQQAADVVALERSAALVLRPENRRRANVQPMLPGALAVDLCNRVRAAQTFDESARISGEMPAGVRSGAVQWIRQLSATPAEAWMAELLLLLPDAPLPQIADALKRADLATQNANTYRAFLTTILAGIRERFDVTGALAVASIARDLPPDALRNLVGVMEETAARDSDRTRQAGWLLAIARAEGVAPAVAARIVLANNLLPSLKERELAALAQAFFAMEEKLAQALASLAEGSALHCALAAVLAERLKHAWTPRTAAAADVLRRIFLGASAGDFDAATAAHLTAAAFLAATTLPRAMRAELSAAIVILIDRLAARDVTTAQAVLLLRALQRLGRVDVKRRTLNTLLDAARARRPDSVWNRLRRHLRLSAYPEAAA
jgi:hypothetical protein